MWWLFGALFLVWAVALLLYLGLTGYQRRGVSGLMRWTAVGLGWMVVAAVLATLAAWPPFGYLSVAATALLLAGMVWLLSRPVEERFMVILVRDEAAIAAGEEGENASARSGNRLRH